jgi:hypothetical protein
MATLAEAAKLCLDSFATLLPHIADRPADYSADHSADHPADHPFLQQMPFDGLHDQGGRFRVWCGNLGALQKGHGSLDHRLRESRIMQGAVSDMMR